MDKKEKNKCQRNFLTFIFCLFICKNINNLTINIKNILTIIYTKYILKVSNEIVKYIRRCGYGKTKEDGENS